MTAIEVSRTSFEDLDEYAAWGAELGWDGQHMQLSAGANRVIYDHLGDAELMIARHSTTRAMLSRFAIPEGVVVFIITRVKVPFHWSGREVEPTVLAVARDGVEHAVMLPAGADFYEFTVSEALVHGTELFPPSFFARTRMLQEAWLPLPEPQTGRFLAMLDATFVSDDDAAGHSLGVRGSELVDLVIGRLQGIIDIGLAMRDGSPPRRTRRSDLLGKAEALMDARLAEEITTGQLADALGVSYRVLNYAVRDAYGVSPGRLLQMKRLHAARRLLSVNGTSVIEAALSVGLSSPSRFASQYRRLFHELPSETRRSNGRDPA